jgi:hypothetical protein
MGIETEYSFRCFSELSRLSEERLNKIVIVWNGGFRRCDYEKIDKKADKCGGRHV